MSIIERAINKLDGVSAEEPEDGAENNIARPESLTEVKSSDEIVLSSDKDASENSAVSLDDNVAKVPTHSKLPEFNAPEPQHPHSRQTETPAESATSNRYVHLDFDRMKAAGFLTAESGISSQSEEYQQLKRRVIGNTVAGIIPGDKPSNMIMITSSVPSEGKTFTSTNLAMSIAAEIDRTVLGIDADIAKRDFTKVFGGLGKPGLFDYLADDSFDLADVIMKTNLSNFSFIPAGLIQDTSTELLASSRMAEAAMEISRRYPDRLIIVDTPPVLASSAALALAPIMGQILLVVESGKTKQETLHEALRMFDDVQITGLVLNKSKQLRRNSYDYYGYYYSAVE